MDFKEIAKEVLKIEADELLQNAQNIDSKIAEIVEMIYKTKGKLIITGVGKSGLVGSKMAATFASTGTSSFFLHPTEAMHGDLGMIGADDTLLAISYSGESEELIKMIPHIKRLGVPLIGMSGDENSTLAKSSDLFLSIKVNKEACPLNAAPTSSTTLTMALGDALAVCLMRRREFKKEDFASFHPGGTLGKKLFVKLKDVMRKNNLPKVSSNTSLKDAIITMSEGRLGVVMIEDKNKLIGILTDGDLRRALMREDFNIEHKVTLYASLKPKTINDSNILASDALKIIEEQKLQHIIITNKENVIEGLIHIHDLVEMGIKS
ncbi:MAG: KpsF/GutQ family sugar-phosphate isomerase [Sulfurospirillum sp.]|nr:MAG: KpsF/GutQ family sugar-phosphate isomerase [Sulfurospirillum sp.]